MAENEVNPNPVLETNNGDIGKNEALDEDPCVIAVQEGIQSEALARIERSFELREIFDKKVSLARIRAYLMQFSAEKTKLREHILKTQTSLSNEINERVLTIIQNCLQILQDFFVEIGGENLRTKEIVASIRNVLQEDLTPAVVFSKTTHIENILLKQELAELIKEFSQNKEYTEMIDGKLHIDHVSGLPNKQAFLEDLQSLLIEQLTGNRYFSVLSLKLIDDPKSPGTTRFLPDDISLKNFKDFITLLRDFFGPIFPDEEILSPKEIEMVPVEKRESTQESENLEDIFISVEDPITEGLDEESLNDYRETLENRNRLAQEMLMIFSTIGAENVGFTDLMAQDCFQYRDALDEWRKEFKHFRIYNYGAGNIMIILDGTISQNRDLVFDLRNTINERLPVFDVNMSLAAFSDTSINSISQKFEETNSPQIVQNSMDTIFSLLSMGQHFAEKFGKDNVNIAVNNSICVFGDDEVSSDSSQEGKFDPFKAVLMPENQFKARCAQNNADMFLRVYNAVRAGKMKKRK